MARIIHIVQFAYQPHLTPADKAEVAARFLALEDTALLEDGSKFLKATGGVNNSPEGLAKGFEHAFVITFASKADRDYYVDREPAHQAFKAYIKDKLSDVLVMDFEDGVF